MSGGDTRLWQEFEQICDCGGRQSGTISERRAVTLLRELGAQATGVTARVVPTAYRGWRAVSARLEDAEGRSHPVTPLLLSAPTAPGGAWFDLVDLGRGARADFAEAAGRIPGRAVLVRHELMFSADTIHRRLKYGWAVEHGAAAFLIAGPVEGSTVAGSSGRGDEPGIPAIGISPETAAALCGSGTRIRLDLATQEAGARADNLFFDLPGNGPGCVVLSAHIDGHALGESAIDNASGLAVALAVARALAPGMAVRRRGLQLAFFNVEEWALNGSADHVARLGPQERAEIALNINLDSVAGGERLTALTSGFAGLEPFLAQAARRARVPLAFHRPLQRNSDHANFAEAGIPAFRLVAGFGEPRAATRLVLTGHDTRALVAPGELARAAALATAIAADALAADPDEAAHRRGHAA